jgi:hypothetical protein
MHERHLGNLVGILQRKSCKETGLPSLSFFLAEFSVSGNVTGHFHSKTVLVKEKHQRIFNKDLKGGNSFSWA